MKIGRSILFEMLIAHPVIMAILLIVAGILAFIFIKYIIAIAMLIFIVAAAIFSIIGIRKTKAAIPIEWKVILVIGIVFTLMIAAFSVNKMAGIEWPGDVPGDGWRCSVVNPHPVDWEQSLSPPVFTATIDTDCPNAYVSFEYQTDIGYYVSSVEAGYIYVGAGIHTVSYSPADYNHASEFTSGAVYKWSIIVWNYDNTTGTGAAIWQKYQTPGSYDFYWYYRIVGQTDGENHTLTVNVDPSGGGTVSPSSGTYSEGTIITLIASPNSGYRFDHWSGAAVSTNITTTITMPGYDINVTAHFVKESSNVIWYAAGAVVAVGLAAVIYRRRKK